MENKEEKLKRVDIKKNKGITLIALVITIIVLLILAGVTIITLTGENGVVSKSVKAKTENKNASIKEAIDLTRAEVLADNYNKGDDEILSQIQKKLNDSTNTIQQLGNSINATLNSENNEKYILVQVDDVAYKVTSKATTLLTNVPE